jgi:hypothetical protein
MAPKSTRTFIESKPWYDKASSGLIKQMQKLVAVFSAAKAEKAEGALALFTCLCPDLKSALYAIITSHAAMLSCHLKSKAGYLQGAWHCKAEPANTMLVLLWRDACGCPNHDTVPHCTVLGTHGGQSSCSAEAEAARI